MCSPAALTLAVRSPTRSRFGPTSRLFQFQWYEFLKLHQPSWCFDVRTTSGNCHEINRYKYYNEFYDKGMTDQLLKMVLSLMHVQEDGEVVVSKCFLLALGLSCTSCRALPPSSFNIHYSYKPYICTHIRLLFNMYILLLVTSGMLLPSA